MENAPSTVQTHLRFSPTFRILDDKGNNLTKEVQKVLEAEPQIYSYNLKVLEDDPVDYRIVLRESTDLQWFWDENNFIIDTPSKGPSELAILIVNCLWEAFSPQVMEVWSKFTRFSSTVEPSRAETKRTVQFSPQYRVLLSLLVGEGNHEPINWDIENAIQKYFNPLIEQLASLAKLNIETQIQYFVEDAEAYIKDDKFCTKHADLPNLVNNFEKYLCMY